MLHLAGEMLVIANAFYCAADSTFYFVSFFLLFFVCITQVLHLPDKTVTFRVCVSCAYWYIASVCLNVL